MSNEVKELKIRFPESLQAGVYANNLMISHTKEEFILDFLLTAPPAGSVVSRVVVSPGHVKRMISALQHNIEKYERTHGKVDVSDAQPAMKMGFSG